MKSLPRREPLALLPTPFERCDRLSAAWGGPTIWVKRDDLTGFGVSGNKVRKLEFHVAAAMDRGATALITCGAEQSNHCRATALAAARLGLDAILFIRTPDGTAPPSLRGNHLLHHLAGAAIRYITPEEYRARDSLMAAEALAHGNAWVIPEGASDALGMWGYVVAMMELDDQLAAVDGPIAALWHPASSGGTTAGIGWALDRLGQSIPIVGTSVGDAAGDLVSQIQAIWSEAAALSGSSVPATPVEILDDYVGGGYGVVTDAELAVQVEATRLTGLLFDPTYTGKSIFALREEIIRGRFDPGDNVVFWHTGGGFAVFAHDFTGVLA